MKYVFYSIALIVCFFVVTMFYPTPDDDRKQVCKSLYQKYNQELTSGSPREMEIQEIDELCDEY